MMDEFPIPAKFNVIATVDGMDTAREVIQRLVREGIDASHIALLGAANAEAEARTSARTAQEEDIRGARHVGARIALFAALGIATGTGLGAALALGVGWRAGYLAAAMITGALAFGVAGGMLGGVSALPLSDEWTRTFRTVGNREAVVAIRSDLRKDFVRASEVLEDDSAIEVHRYIRRGNKLRAA